MLFGLKILLYSLLLGLGCQQTTIETFEDGPFARIPWAEGVAKSKVKPFVLTELKGYKAKRSWARQFQASNLRPRFIAFYTTYMSRRGIKLEMTQWPHVSNDKVPIFVGAGIASAYDGHLALPHAKGTVVLCLTNGFLDTACYLSKGNVKDIGRIKKAFQRRRYELVQHFVEK